MIPTIDHPVLCTSLAQSKALQEAGIDPKTADMTWVHSPFTPKCAYGEEHYMPFCYPGAVTSNDPTGTPCWSVNALMSLLPKTMPDPLNVEHELRLTIQPTMSAWSAFYYHDGRMGESVLEKELVAALVLLAVKVFKR